MTPSMCRIVVYRQPSNEAPHNGRREHPAIVNHVWGEGETPSINLTVFPDSASPYCRTSVSHVSKAGADMNAWDWPQRAE